MRLKAITGIVLTMLLLVVVSQTGFSVGVVGFDGESGDFMAQSSFDWWYSNWTRRKLINITEHSGSNLTNYQLKLVVEHASDMQDDFDDLRFTYYDGATEEPIPYWIEKYSANENATVWVNVTYIPANGTSTIYMYYGNPTVGNASDGDAVFEFFDDFTGKTIDVSKWITVGPYFAQDEVLKTTGGRDAWNTDGIYSVNNYTRPFVLEWKERVVEYGAPYTGSLWGTRLASVAFNDSRDGWYMYNSATWVRKLTCYEDCVTQWYQTYFWTLETWYDFKLVIKSAGITAFVDGVQKWDGTNGTTSPLHIGTVHYDGLYEWDDVRVRKYAFPEPTYVPYDVTIKAYCYTEDVDVSVNITMDGSPTGFTTPHTFTGLNGTHNFTVPNTDPSGHPFKQWNTGETSTTITVTSGGTYTAYYEAPPSPPVGGIWAPVDKFGLFAPYIALFSTIILAISASVALIKYRKKQ